MHGTGETPPEPAQKTLTPQEEYKIDVIKSHLSRLSVLEIDIVNARDFAHASPAGQEVLSHISSHFRAKHDNVPALMNFEEFMEQWRGMYAQMPEIRLEVTNVWCHVDDDKQHATVHLDTVLKGSAPDLAVGAMGELQWKVRKTDGRWMLMKLPFPKSAARRLLAQQTASHTQSATHEFRQHTATARRSRYGRLAAELRDNDPIYMAMKYDARGRPDEMRILNREFNPRPLSLLAVCCQARDECTEMFFANNHFKIGPTPIDRENAESTTCLDWFLNMIDDVGQSYVRHISVLPTTRRPPLGAVRYCIFDSSEESKHVLVTNVVLGTRTLEWSVPLG